MYKQIRYNQLFFFIGMLACWGSFAQNVGIGSTQFVPSSTLEIRGLSALSTDYALKVRNSASTDLLVVQNNGNVGINVSSPSTKLHVVGDAYVTQHLSVGGASIPTAYYTILSYKLFFDGAADERTGITCHPLVFSFTTPQTGNVCGAFFQPDVTGLGGVIASNVMGARSRPYISLGVATNVFGYYAANPFLGAGGTVTNAYGLYLENMTVGTTNYSIYSAGGQNYFAGNVGVGSSSPNSSLNVNGSFATTITTKIANYTITASDYTVLTNATAGGFTITLPTAVGIAARIIVIKKTDATANVIAVTTTSAQTIDGVAPPLNIAVPNDRITVQSDGANWVRID